MSLYLAWSLEQLVVVLVVGIALVLFSIKSLVSNGFVEAPLKLWHKVVAVLVFLVVVSFSSINVGVRQSELGRSTFNGDTPVQTDKVERDDLDSDKVNELFKESLKEKK